MPYFKASVQYGDWTGTAAADEHGGNDDRFEELFTATGKVDSDESLIAFTVFAGERDFSYLVGYFHKEPINNSGGIFPTLNAQFQKETDPIEVKAVRVEITLQDFFRLFKRFNVVLARGQISIAGREYRATGDE